MVVVFCVAELIEFREKTRRWLKKPHKKEFHAMCLWAMGKYKTECVSEFYFIPICLFSY